MQGHARTDGRIRSGRCRALAALLTLIAASAALADDPNEPNDDAGSATPLSCPSYDSVGTAIEAAGDLDYYLLVGPAGTLVTLDVDAAATGSDLDAILGVFDAFGALVRVSDDAPAPGEDPDTLDPFIAITLPDDGFLLLAVASYDDLDFDGVSDTGTGLTTGDYTLSVRCTPATAPPPGQLLASTGSAGLVLADVDAVTVVSTIRAVAGRFGPVTDLEAFPGVLYGSTGSGKANLIAIDTATGEESLYCHHESGNVTALAAVHGLLYGAWSPGGGNDAVLITVGDPLPGVEVDTLSFLFFPVDGAAPTLVTQPVTADEPVDALRVEISYQTQGASVASDLHVTMTHVATGTEVRLGSVGTDGHAGSCATWGCDAELGLPSATGTYAVEASVAVAALPDPGGDWEVLLRDSNDDAGMDGIMSNFLARFDTRLCQFLTVGTHGRSNLGGLAWHPGTATLYGCTPANDPLPGRLLTLDLATGAGSLVGPLGYDGCTALTMGPPAGVPGGAGVQPVLYGGTGTIDTVPGALYTVDPATAATTQIGVTGLPGLSGLSFFEPDIDGDGLTDGFDNCLFVPNADQLDTDLDRIGNACDADVTQDCQVNFGDLAAVKAAFLSGPGDANFEPGADFNGDDAVNFGDLAFLKSQFLVPPGPAALPAICGP